MLSAQGIFSLFLWDYSYFSPSTAIYNIVFRKLAIVFYITKEQEDCQEPFNFTNALNGFLTFEFHVM
ncbi:hypothetical protein FH5_01299 [Priestia endophytica]|nr:hypothetical protein FH5_01299 [Priestia endophytica]